MEIFKKFVKKIKLKKQIMIFFMLFTLQATPATNLVSLPYTKATAKKRDAKTVFLAHEILCDIGDVLLLFYFTLTLNLENWISYELEKYCF